LEPVVFESLVEIVADKLPETWAEVGDGLVPLFFHLPILPHQLGYLLAIGRPVIANFPRKILKLNIEAVGAEPATELALVGRPPHELGESRAC
jgi:hypothetical protein